MAEGRRPLVMRCGAFGDMVLLTPLIRRLAASFGTAVDIVSSGGWTRPLLAGQPGVGTLYLLNSRRRPFLISPDQWALVRQLRERGPGPTWFLDPAGVGKSLLTRAGIGAEWIVDADELPPLPGEHYLERFARLARLAPPALGRPVAASAASLGGTALEVDPAARIDLDRWLAGRGLAGQPLLLVQAGNKRTMRRGARRRPSNTKYWPEDRWAEVIAAMRARCPGHALVLLGVPSEYALNEDIRRLVGATVVNAAAELPIPRLLALLERAEALVSVDTGPAHAAAALGLPEVVLFGAADPALYRPWGARGAPVVCVRAEPPGPLEGLPAAPVIAAFRNLPLRAAG